MKNFKQYINESNIDKIKEECKDIDPNIDYSSDDWQQEFIDSVNWVDISWKQKLSKDFIKHFKDYVDWRFISWGQDLSEEFIKKHKNDIDFKWLFENKYIINEFIFDNIQWFINEDINENSWRLKNKEFKNKFNKYKKLFGG